MEFGWPAREPYLDGPDVRASMSRAARGDPLSAFAAARQRLARHSEPPKALVMTYAEPGHPALTNSAFLTALTLSSPSGHMATNPRQDRVAGAEQGYRFRLS